MKFEAKIIKGWSCFGFGYIRYYVDDDNYYTAWTIFLTKKFSLGIHIGGSKRSPQC